VIATAVPKERTWVLVRAAEADGRPVRADAPPSAAKDPQLTVATPVPSPWQGPFALGSAAQPFGDLLAAEAALAAEDSDRAEQAADRLAKAESFAEGVWLRARVEDADPTRSRGTSAAREQRLLARALELAPDLDAARLRLLRLRRSRGEDADIQAELEALPRERLRTLGGELLRHQVYDALGNELRAEEALRRAEKLNPTHCEVLATRRSLASARGETAREDELLEQLGRCAGTLELRARGAAERARWEESARHWGEVLERTPDHIDALEALAALAVTTGRPDEALARLGAILERNPYRVAAHIARADLLAARGQLDAGEAEARAALERLPHASELHRAAAPFGIADDLLEFREDGAAAFAKYLRSAPTMEGVSEVLVLDRSVARVYPNGGVRMLIQLVVQVREKDAIDRYGEITVPENGTLLSLRSIKPDGTVTEPESVGGKESLSLRDLAVGDAVEYEYVIDRPPPATMPGHVDVTGFRFQSPDVPYERSELVVVHPAAMPLREERRQNPPNATEERRGDLVVKTWRAERMPRLGVEPQMRSTLDELPSVRIFTDLDVDQWLRATAMELRLGARGNPELRRLVAKLTKGAKDDEARLRRIWRWVLEHIEQSGGLTSAATGTLSDRRGDRITLLRAMLREAGLRVELHLAAPRFGPSRIPGGHPLVEHFEVPVLLVWLAGRDQPVPILPEARVVPLGYLAPPLVGAETLRLPLEGAAAGRSRLPTPPEHLADRRTTALELELDARGSGEVRGTIELRGMEAIAWRQALEQIDRDRVEEVFQQAEIGRLGRGLTLESLTIEHEKDLEKPLRLRFSAAARELGVLQGEGMTLGAGLVPLNAAQPYTSLPQRKTGLAIGYAPVQEATVEVRLKGAKIHAAPGGAKIQLPEGSYEREVSVAPDAASVRLRLRSQLRPGIVEPAQYSALQRLARAVEDAERAVIEVRATGGARP
jgi:tetratricopeptide (TPR) repeat protein